MIETAEQFFLWEHSSRDTIDFKKIYVDISGDLNAGLVLSEIIYWHLPSKNGDSKLKVEHGGVMWIACRRYEWWERTRMTPRQADRALNILSKRGLIAKDVFKYGGEPTTHVAIVWEQFLPAIREVIENPPDNPFLPIGNNGITESVKTFSPTGENEITAGGTPVTENTSENTEKDHLASPGEVQSPSVNGRVKDAVSEQRPAMKKEPALDHEIASRDFGTPLSAKNRALINPEHRGLYESDPIFMRFVKNQLDSFVFRGENGAKGLPFGRENRIAALNNAIDRDWSKYESLFRSPSAPSEDEDRTGLYDDLFGDIYDNP